jgi:DNA modification methylase
MQLRIVEAYRSKRINLLFPFQIVSPAVPSRRAPLILQIRSTQLMFPKKYASKNYVSYHHECAHLVVKGSPWAVNKPIPDVIEWKYTGNKLHPPQKPLEVIMPLIEAFSSPGDIR